MTGISRPMYAPQGAADAAIEAGAVALWGGRAIDKRGALDLPYDRMHATGDLTLLRGFKVQEQLRKVELAYRDLPEDEAKVVHQYPLERAHLIARKSGGYVYLLLAVYR